MFKFPHEWPIGFFNAKWAIFRLYHDKKKLHFNKMIMMSALYEYETNTLSWIFMVLDDFVLDQHP